MTIQDEAGPQVPPVVGEYALQERAKLLSDNAGLRARLANYEDADGRPVSTLAEQAQQIGKLILARDDYKKQAHDYRAKWAAAIASGDSPVGALEAIRAEFPILDDEGLDQEAHHCEWAIQQDRKRLNRFLDALSPNHSEQVRHMVPQMVDFSPVPDDFRSQANGYRAGWNDCRAAIAAAPSAGSQGGDV